MRIYFLFLVSAFILAVLTFLGWNFYFALSQNYQFHWDIFISAFIVGLFAQLVDGALGMAYGVTSTSFLVASGLSPLSASASVHVAEIFTTGASGLSHWRLGNIDKTIFKAILLPGVFGAIIGVILLTNFDIPQIKPFINGYLILMGFVIIWRIIYKTKKSLAINVKKIKYIAILGGFVDSLGGGWGPIMTGNLSALKNDTAPKNIIGSVNTSEFFITLVSGISLSFFTFGQNLESIAGLIIGGVIIAPFAAKITQYFNQKYFIFIGIFIIAINIYGLVRYFKIIG